MVFERGNHVIESKHVKLRQVDQFHEVRDGYISRYKYGVRLISIEVETVVGASSPIRTEIRIQRPSALPASEFCQIAISVLDIDQDVHQCIGIHGDGSDHAQGFLYPDTGAKIIHSWGIQCDDAHAKPINVAFGLFEEEGLGVSSCRAIDVVRSLRIDEGDGLAGKDG